MPVPVLMYHTLDAEVSPISTPPDLFAQQMRWLSDHGYGVIRLREVIQCLRNGSPLPGRSVVITFDDGFESVYRTAFPILSRLNFPATIFLVTAYCGQSSGWPDEAPGIPSYPLMSWAQICELDRSGMEFGAHGVHHRRLDGLSVNEAAQEILQSKACIEDRLGHVVEHFAYPYNRYNTTVKAIVQRAFTGACAGWPRLVRHDSDPWELPRIESQYVAWPPLFRHMPNRAFTLYLGVRSKLRASASLLLRRTWT